ncbi:MAG: DUF4469 domain-containing protein, partial [Tannerella sp.]|nr:DUF4469 domain-containing protein [Tannerella sp.]
HPEVRVTASATLRKYIGENVQIVFDGVEDPQGMIGEVKDEATGKIDEVITRDNIVTIRGYGLKIESDADHAAQAGVFPVSAQQQEIPFKAVAPRTLKLISPANISAGAYTILIRTQSNVKYSGHLLKELREVRSEFTLTVQ